MKQKYLHLIIAFFCLYNVMGQNCDTPTNILVTAINSNEAAVSWTAGGTETQWEVAIAPSGSPTPTSGIITSTNPLTLNGLTPCTSYNVWVRAICIGNINSNWSSTFTFTTTQLTINCNALVTGNTMTINASGGTPPYQYSINGGAFQTSNIFTGLTNGNYNYIVKDANGCTCSGTTTINSLNVIIQSSLDIPTSTLFAQVTNGVAPYTYQWSLNNTIIPGANSPQIGILGASGCYSVQVTDNNGLTGSAQYCTSNNILNANNDTLTLNFSSTNTVTSSISVLANDYFNSFPVSTSNITLTPLVVPTGFQLNTNGTISILPGTPSGTYTLTYRICETALPSNCSSATATITVYGNGLLLKAFIDTNNNGIKDSGENYFTNGQFSIDVNNSGTPSFVQSTSGTHYIAESSATNLYDLTFVIDPTYTTQYTYSGTPYNDLNYTAGSGVQEVNFPITELPFYDLETQLFSYYPRPLPAPGFTYNNRILYRNNGNQTIPSGTITFTKDNLVSITSISQSGTTSNATGFTYTFANLLPHETRFIDVTMQVPTIPTVSLGNTLTNSVTSTTAVSEVSLTNNVASLTQVIVGSYDPNDKQEAHGGKIVHSTFTNDDYLTYTIRFENTGTANAENVRINDVLDAKLDETTIKTVASSHSYILERNGSILNWNFNNIQLPPSVANTSTGKGFVTFQIKPKAGFLVGDVIPNKANIYFDFNPAIITNICNTEFVTTLNSTQFEVNNFSLYPNPAKDFITIQATQNNTISSVMVTDISGKTIYNNSYANESKVEINLSNFSTGIYFIKVSLPTNETQQMKFIKD
ncbi:MAG: T9SS type A sorting domain-containing protein [Limnohabitans sp.]|nr:T9SS type A sorting domain-containing protein [Limnohabitans sp.]